MSQILTDTLESMAREIRLLKREVSDLRRRERGISGGGGVTDHGLLTGLGDNDHTQYALKSGDTFSGNVTVNNRLLVNGAMGTWSAAEIKGENDLSANYSLICRNLSGTSTFWVNNEGSALVRKNLQVVGSLINSVGQPYINPQPFWIPPAAFGGVSWIGFGNNRIQDFPDGSISAIDTFFSIPVAGKRLELTGLMTSNVVGNLDTAVELRYLQEAGGQPSTPTTGSTMLFTINPAFAVRKKTVILDVSSYAADSTFALRFYRNGSSTADTSTGHGYFFGFSGRWID